MLHRLFRAAGLLIAALALGPAAAATTAPTQPQRIIAVGDLHGDYEAWIDIARAAGLIDAQNRWAGGRTTLVQLGDITDRGGDSLKIIRNLQQLQREAPASGGSVVVMLGNHEAMNLLGDLRYVTPGEFAAFVDNRSPARRERLYMANRRALEAAARAANRQVLPSKVREEWLAQTPLGWAEHRAAWSPSGALGRWAMRNPAVLKIGDTLFAHGGLSVEYSRTPIAEINRQAAAAMAAVDGRDASILRDPLGPLWYRGLITRDPRIAPEAAAASRPPIEQELSAILAATGARRIVVGHTPTLSGIIVSHDGRLIRTDSGNSRHYGGQLSYVEITGDSVAPRKVPRSTPLGR